MRTWAEINLDAIEHNIKEIRRVTNKNAKIMAVVKADAYGHGVEKIAHILDQNGADAFAVATIDEALQLRSFGFTKPILILAAIPEESIPEAVENDITLSVFSWDYAKKISCAAIQRSKTAQVHIKLDTGMSRIGYVVNDTDNSEILNEILKISMLDNIFIEGIFSHFSTSDESDDRYTRLQFNRFLTVCSLLEKSGLQIPVRHIANSAAVFMYPEYHLDMVRPGIILYGLYPSNEVDKNRINLKPAMSLKSKITHIKTLEKDRGVSYGKDYITTDCVKVATVPVGYADGYLRSLAKEGKMLIHNKKVKIMGRICMDQCMIDVTNVNNINIGDEVTLFSDCEITADTLADWIGTINYEIICMISKRIPRIYKQHGRTVKILNFLKKEN